MNKQYFDTAQMQCFLCGHIWILASDKFIIESQFKDWIRDFLEYHNKIHKKKEE